jgi:cell division protein FtsW
MSDMTFGRFDDSSVFGRWARTVDVWTLSAVILLFLIGLVLGLAASPPLAARNGLDPFYYVGRQAVFGAAAFGGLLVLSLATPERVRRLGVALFAVVFLSVLLLPVLGSDFGKGAVRWYSLGFTSVQPSEFLKPLFVITAAWLMAASFADKGPPGVTLSFLLAGMVAVSLAMQPDFGQAALILAAWGVMFFVAGASVLWLIGLGAGVAAAAMAAYANSEHFARRIDAYLSPDLDPTTQLGFATNAILNGGFLGVGPGEGVVKRSLPDAHTDFIIAVAAEEYGLLLVLPIIGLFLFIAIRALSRLMRERDVFIRLAGVGLVSILTLQALVNLGVAIRVLPAKGMTLPFISYGGSSLVATGLTVGMLLALTRRRPQDDVTDLL